MPERNKLAGAPQIAGPASRTSALTLQGVGLRGVSPHWTQVNHPGLQWITVQQNNLHLNNTINQFDSA
jgi:hypothetical protein